MENALDTVAFYAAALVVAYVGTTTFLASAVAVVQESKIWKSKALPSLSLYGGLKVFVFNAIWMLFCLLGSIIISLKWLLTFGTSNIEKEASRFVEDKVARLVIHSMVGGVEVRGIENLPPEDQRPSPVYVANHASQLDIAAVYFLERWFHWIAKRSVLYLPGVGTVMYLGRHVLIDRRTGKNKKSVTNLFDKCSTSVQVGVPVFFFPQGTRRIAEKRPFKDGAFIVAQSNCSTLVPISIDIPMNAWNSSYPFSLLWSRSRPTVKLTVHKPILVTGKEDKEELKQKCMTQIYSVLPEVYGADSKKGD
jgi:1-acyl-sn-glycerol-3-phosphate acyltransferase